MAGEYGSSASGAPLSEHFMETTGYAEKKAALAESFAAISPSHAEAAAQAAVEAGAVPGGVQSQSVLNTPAPETPGMTVVPGAEASPPTSVVEPLAVKPEALPGSSAIEQAWQATQQLLQQKNLGSRFVVSETGVQLEVYDGSLKLNRQQLEAVLQLREPGNWQKTVDQLGQFIGQASKEFFVNRDGLQSIAAAPETIPLPPSEKKPSFWDNLKQIGSNALARLSTWAKRETMPAEAQSLEQTPAVQEQVMQTAEKGQRRLLDSLWFWKRAAYQEQAKTAEAAVDLQPEKLRTTLRSLLAPFQRLIPTEAARFAQHLKRYEDRVTDLTNKLEKLYDPAVTNQEELVLQIQQDLLKTATSITAMKQLLAELGGDLAIDVDPYAKARDEKRLAELGTDQKTLQASLVVAQAKLGQLESEREKIRTDLTEKQKQFMDFRASQQPSSSLAGGAPGEAALVVPTPAPAALEVPTATNL